MERESQLPLCAGPVQIYAPRLDSESVPFDAPFSLTPGSTDQERFHCGSIRDTRSHSARSCESNLTNEGSTAADACRKTSASTISVRRCFGSCTSSAYPAIPSNSSPTVSSTCFIPGIAVVSQSFQFHQPQHAHPADCRHGLPSCATDPCRKTRRRHSSRPPGRRVRGDVQLCQILPLIHHRPEHVWLHHGPFHRARAHVCVGNHDQSVSHQSVRWSLTADT